MIYFIISYFHSGCSVDNTLKEDQSGDKLGGYYNNPGESDGG